MSARNLACWAGVLLLFIALLVWSRAQPIEFVRYKRSWWARALEPDQQRGARGRDDLPVKPQKPPPSPPPEPLTRAEAEQGIRVSSCVEHADVLIPALRRSIRVSATDVDRLGALPKGASRFAGVPDVPASFAWPRFKGQPLHLIAQIRLTDVTAFDEDGLLPKTGWLCFFYAAHAEPTVTGRQPGDRGGWSVVHFAGDAEQLKRTAPPKPLKADGPAVALRFWSEWTLPSLGEEPTLLAGGQRMFLYGDLCAALAGRPEDEDAWHHLLGHAQNNAGPMRPVCALASSGTALPEDRKAAEKLLAEAADDAREWRLLLQVELPALEHLNLPPSPEAPASPRSAEGTLYFWMRADDLSAGKFERVWVQRQGYFEDYYDYGGASGAEDDDEAGAEGGAEEAE